jgi:orotate phosphoribosyltransferase-like protein
MLVIEESWHDFRVVLGVFVVGVELASAIGYLLSVW